MSSHISKEMRSVIGGELSRTVSFPIAESDIRKWALAVYFPEVPPRVFWDEEAAAQSTHGGIVAPEEFNPFAWMAADPPGPRRTGGGSDPDKTEKALGVAGPGLKHQLNGGQSAEYGVRMRPGDVITAVGRLGGYSEREARLGLMLFTNTETTWTNQDDELVKRVTMTLIRY